MEWTKTMDIADGETDGDGGTEKQENGGSETEGMKVKTMASTEGMKVKAMARVKAMKVEGMARVEGMVGVEVEGMAAVEVEGMAEDKI